MKPTRVQLPDPTVFFSATAAVAAVPLLYFAARAYLDSLAANTSALVVQTAADSTFGLMTAAFVFVPAAIVFIGIALPFAFRTISALSRGELSGREKVALAAIVVGFLILALEATSNRNGLMGFFVVFAAAIFGASPMLSGGGHRATGICLGLAATALAGLCYFEYQLLAGHELSRALAPTCLVTAWFMGFFGTAASVVSGITERALRSSFAAAMALTLWLVSPVLANQVGVDSSGGLETTLTGVAAALFFLAGTTKLMSR